MRTSGDSLDIWPSSCSALRNLYLGPPQRKGGALREGILKEPREGGTVITQRHKALTAGHRDTAAANYTEISKNMIH